MVACMLLCHTKSWILHQPYAIVIDPRRYSFSAFAIFTMLPSRRASPLPLSRLTRLSPMPADPSATPGYRLSSFRCPSRAMLRCSCAGSSGAAAHADVFSARYARAVARFQRRLSRRRAPRAQQVLRRRARAVARWRSRTRATPRRRARMRVPRFNGNAARMRHAGRRAAT